MTTISKDANLHRAAQKQMSREVEGLLEAGKWGDAAKMLGISPRAALASRSTFRSALSSAGVDWSPSISSRWSAWRHREAGAFVDRSVL